ncbi:hypothetical protein GCM10027058_29910 [Microbacterium neimengense]
MRWNRRSRNASVEVELDLSAPKLSSLAPQYSFNLHGVYFTMLKTTLDTAPDIRNIALAGTYGTGKSSILRQIAQVFAGRVVELSLLTLGVQPESSTAGDANLAANSTTNRIQKEIVKQLLYQQRPTDAPESRFHRIARFQWRTELRIAAIVAAFAVALALAAGLDIVTTPTLGLTISGRTHVVSLIFLFAAIAVLVGAAAFTLRAVARGKVGIERVSAGPAAISLSARSTSYFDEYLDEIIYFFETNPQRDIVIIEDLDRFNDPNIFESLRSLNGILNAAKQLSPRRIRFIYAVRDSVFEKLGRDASEVHNDEARAELARANRTKFFELVIPVVPFITHKNARDLMKDELNKRGHSISEELVKVAAQHVADMRLLHNVINEYEVFKHRLLDVDNAVPELDPDRLFAMILFKNAHMGDFESIRLAESSLDILWNLWREVIQFNTDELRATNRKLSNRLRETETATKHAKRVGERLRGAIDAFAAAPGSPLISSELLFRGTKVDDSRLQTVEFWEEFCAADEPLNSRAYQAGYGSRELALSASTIRALVGLPLTPERLTRGEHERALEEIAANEESIAFLQRHTWAKLAARPEFTYTPSNADGPRSFRELVRETLPSPLASELVINGFITSYFTLHVSTFYGAAIRKDAQTYVMRFIDEGRPGIDYPLDDQDVAAILGDQPGSVIAEQSMLNIGVMNYLLVNRPADASTVARTAVNGGETGLQFIDQYLGGGLHKLLFVRTLAPHMSEIFDRLATASILETSERVALIDAAILCRDAKVNYLLTNALRELLTTEFSDLPSFGPGGEEVAAQTVAYFLDEADVTVDSLEQLPAPAARAFRPTQAYALTRENLERVTGSADISLDALYTTHEEVFTYAASTPSDYAKALEHSETTPITVHSSKLLQEYLKLAAGSTPESVLAGAAPQAQLPALAAISPTTWPLVARHRMVAASYANVSAYVQHFGEIDNNLAETLSAVTQITDVGDIEQPARTELALEILNSAATNLGGAQRVRLARSLSPTPFSASQIDPLAGSKVGDLIAAGLLADDAEAFSERLMVDWPTQRHAIVKSANFSSFVSPDTLRAEFVDSLLRDDSLAPTHLPVAKILSTYDRLPIAAYEVYAERAMKGAYDLNAPGIRMVHNGGASPETTLKLLGRFISRLSHDELREILRSLDSPWSKIADPGYGVKHVTDVEGARKILTALSSAAVVSTFSEKGSEWRVTLHQPPKKQPPS